MAMAEAAGVEIELVELDVAEDDSVRDGFAQILDEAGAGRRARQQRRRRRQRGRRGGDARAVPRRHEHQPVRRHPLPAGRAARDARAAQRGDRQHHVAHRARWRRSPSRRTWRRSGRFEGVSEGLAQELAPFGIRVVIIEPGVTKSAIFAKSVDAPNATGAYDAPYRRMFQFYARGIAEATDPVEVAQVIHHAITTDAAASCATR